ERTHTWFSMFSEDGHTAEAVHTMQYVWNGTKPPYPAPRVQYMLVDQKGARNNIILKANTIKTAEVFMYASERDSIAFSWQILHEDWYDEYKAPAPNSKPMEELIIDTEGQKLQFRTPSQEGPYRIFVEVTDNHGNFATANTPIYV